MIVFSSTVCCITRSNIVLPGSPACQPLLAAFALPLAAATFAAAAALAQASLRDTS